MADETSPAPTEQPPDAYAGLSEDAKQQLADVKTSLTQEMNGALTSGQVEGLTTKPDLEFKQWAFERGEIAQDIQRVNEIKGPGE